MELNGRALRRLKQIVGNIARKFKLVQTDTVVSGPFERWVSTDELMIEVNIKINNDKTYSFLTTLKKADIESEKVEGYFYVFSKAAKNVFRKENIISE